MENRKNAQTGTTIRSAVINQAISYIFEHMDEDITVEDVAHHCAYSKYHLTRMFKEDTGEALYHFIKRVRLERSAWRLKVEKEKALQKLAKSMGILRLILLLHLKSIWIFLRLLFAKAASRL